jgi:hypothetical protein
MNPKIWLSSPHMSGNEQSFINDAFATNWIAPLGTNVNGFEKELAEYYGSSKISYNFKYIIENIYKTESKFFNKKINRTSKFNVFNSLKELNEF